MPHAEKELRQRCRKWHYALALCSGVASLHGSGLAQPATKDAVAMQIRVNALASTTRCALDSFVVANPAPQPETGSTICAVGGPFGNGMVGIALPAAANLAGGTIHLNRTFTFNNGSSAISISSVAMLTDVVPVASGGMKYFDGIWEITGGTGAFKDLRGQGKAKVVIASKATIPPPPQYIREELVGWVTR